MAWSLTRAAAAAALRRSATGATTHGVAPLGPKLPFFGRSSVTKCYRVSGPPDSDEESQKRFSFLDDMDKKTLLQYAKTVTVENATLVKCRYNPVQSGINMRNLKTEVQNLSKKIDEVQKSGEKHKDITSLYVNNYGSINVLAIGSALFTVYQAWGHKAIPSSTMWTEEETFAHNQVLENADR